ncbi:helix-turn-helix transcriptional regulator [Prescottella agglutinans]|nr:hypothetical protein [Prescottella agglutinans]
MGWLLAESRRLLDHAIAEHRSVRGENGDVVRLRPDEGWEGSLQQLLQRVRKEAMLTVASPLRIQPHYQPGRRLVADHLSAGREVRLLYTQHYAETRDYESLQNQPELYDRIRVSDADFHNMVIIDRQVGAIWGGTGARRPYGFVISDPDLLRALHQFAVVLWEAAPRLSRNLTLPQPEFDQSALAVLRALDLGLKDESAARRLGVSLRTYRRYVADIMARLGVTTRFQVGARAAELGLLTASAKQPPRASRIDRRYPPSTA